MLDELFVQLLTAIVLALAGIVSTVAIIGLRAGLVYLRTKLSVERYAFLQRATQTVVRFLEQSGYINDLLREGTKKKETALSLLYNFAEEHDIPVTYELLDTLVEEAVNIMNATFAGAPINFVDGVGEVPVGPEVD